MIAVVVGGVSFIIAYYAGQNKRSEAYEEIQAAVTETPTPTPTPDPPSDPGGGEEAT